VRAVAAVLAWLLACHTSHHTAVTAARLQRQAALHTAATATALTPSSQGQTFDTMSSAKLQALAAELRRGAEQAEHTVNIRQQQQQQQQQQFTTKSIAATSAGYSIVSASATAV
jgi:Rps23 Pro-64 3,4-dihydroxylase Tpa1-like proline 4-hydroxylase